MAVLVVVLAVLVISYASSLRAYLQQHQHIDALTAQIAASKQRIAAMRAEEHRWHDKQYVEQQARARFGWVLPGETAYQVIGPDGKPLAGTDALAKPQAKVPRPVAWWSTAYATLQAADHPPVPKPTPKPVTKIVPAKK
jgi:cell division protein FtsB